MARGPRLHMKRLAAPAHWLLDKLGGIFAPRPRPGPHKLSECLPLLLIVRNRLKYALTYREAVMIVKQRFLKVDNKVRTDIKYPAGFMDVISIEKTGDKFRLLYDTKGRFVLHKIKDNEVNFKLCKVQKSMFGPNRRPFINTHDGRTFNFPDPKIRRGDTVVLDLESGKIKEWLRFKPGCLCMVTAGGNTGRIGVVVSRERHPGQFDIVHLKDATDATFATRVDNVFVIGPAAGEPLVSLPKDKGIRLSLVEDRERRLALNEKGKRKKKSKRGKKGKKGEKKGGKKGAKKGAKKGPAKGGKKGAAAAAKPTKQVKKQAAKPAKKGGKKDGKKGKK